MEGIKVVFKGQGEVGYEKYKLGDPEKKEVMIRNLYTAISPGTELAVLNKLPNTSGDFPFYPGYSGCGVIEKCGEELDDLKGKMVLYRSFHQSFSVIDIKECHFLEGDADPVGASAFRLASISLQAVRKAGIKLGDEVAVVGLGPIGQLAAQFAYFSGASKIVCIDPQVKRRDTAKNIYADEVYASAEECRGTDGYDVVFECTGAPQVIPQAFRITKKMGRTILLGSSRGLTEHVNFYEDIHYRGIQVIGAHESNRASADDMGIYCTNRYDEETVTRFIMADKLKMMPLVDRIYDYKDAARAYEEISSEKLMMAVLSWS